MKIQKRSKWSIVNYKIIVLFCIFLVGCPFLSEFQEDSNSSPTPPPEPKALTVEFTPISPIFKPLRKNLSKHEYQRISYVEFGKVKTSPYQDGTLIRVMHEVHGLEKGGPTNPYSPKKYQNVKIHFYRFVLLDNIAYFLERSSDSYFKNRPIDQFHIHPFEEQRIPIKTDTHSFIEGIERPTGRQFDIPQTRYSFTFHQEVPGTIDPSLKKIGDVPNFGIVYKTHNNQGFRIYRPDQTALILGYRVPFTVEDIRWKIPKPFGDYTYKQKDFFNFAGENFDPTTPPHYVRIPKSELKVIGYTKDRFKQPIYTYKLQNHKILRSSYNRFVRLIKKARKTYPEGELDRLPRIPSYKKFVANVPFFFWKDPFARMIQFTNEHYLPPTIAEPILYLYPKQERKIFIRIAQEVNLLKTWPLYHDGWQVIATPQGNIRSLISNQNFPFIYWEGSSFFIPDFERGFLVNKEDIIHFLEEKLSVLGLLKKEKEDFLSFWVPHLSKFPYVHIHFIDPRWINEIAPLDIQPQPETIIRVWLDFRPLEQPVEILPQKILPASPRKGFTVVEWGGVF